MIPFHINWSLKDLEFYLSEKYGYEVRREAVWYCNYTYNYYAYDKDGNKVGDAKEIFKDDFKKEILGKMITKQQSDETV